MNNFDVGNSTAARMLNTAGYRFNQTDLNNRDQYTGRVDYDASERTTLRGRLQLLQGDRRPHRPRRVLPGPAARLHELRSEAVRAARGAGRPASNFQNELRGGVNLAPVQFVTDWDYSVDGILYNTALGHH